MNIKECGIYKYRDASINYFYNTKFKRIDRLGIDVTEFCSHTGGCSKRTKIPTLEASHLNCYKLLTDIFCEEKLSTLKRIKNYLFISNGYLL